MPTMQDWSLQLRRETGSIKLHIRLAIDTYVTLYTSFLFSLPGARHSSEAR